MPHATNEPREPAAASFVSASDRESRLSELRRLDGLDDDPESWEAAYNQIRQAVRLLAPDGRPVPEFLLHIDGGDAWWRWSDEPFPD